MSEQTITADELEAFIHLWLRGDVGMAKHNKSRAAVDAAIAICLDEGELDLAASMMFLLTARIVGNQREAGNLLLQFHVERNSPIVTRLIESN
jgi:hypothetical protein